MRARQAVRPPGRSREAKSEPAQRAFMAREGASRERVERPSARVGRGEVSVSQTERAGHWGGAVCRMFKRKGE